MGNPVEAESFFQPGAIDPLVDFIKTLSGEGADAFPQPEMALIGSPRWQSSEVTAIDSIALADANTFAASVNIEDHLKVIENGVMLIDTFNKGGVDDYTDDTLNLHAVSWNSGGGTLQGKVLKANGQWRPIVPKDQPKGNEVFQISKLQPVTLVLGKDVKVEHRLEIVGF